MVFDNFEFIEIAGTKYKFSLKNRKAFLCERELRNQNLLKALEEQPMCMEDLFVLFKYSLVVEKPLTEDETFDLYLQAIDQLTYVGLFEKIIQVLMKSGLLGNPKKLQATQV